jgi:hypothetical protein
VAQATRLSTAQHGRVYGVLQAANGAYQLVGINGWGNSMYPGNGTIELRLPAGDALAAKTMHFTGFRAVVSNGNVARF